MEFIGHGINISEDSLLCQPCDEQGGNNSALQCFEDTIELTDAVPINILTTNSVFTANLIVAVEPGQLFVIDEPGNPNNGIYQVKDVVSNSAIFTIITIEEPGVPVQEYRTESMHFAKSVTIDHNLGSSHIIYGVSPVDRGDTLTIKSEIINSNQLQLSPTLPMKGSFRVSIFSKSNASDNDQP